MRKYRAIVEITITERCEVEAYAECEEEYRQVIATTRKPLPPLYHQYTHRITETRTIGHVLELSDKVSDTDGS